MFKKVYFWQFHKGFFTPTPTYTGAKVPLLPENFANASYVTHSLIFYYSLIILNTELQRKENNWTVYMMKKLLLNLGK